MDHPNIDLQYPFIFHENFHPNYLNNTNPLFSAYDNFIYTQHFYHNNGTYDIESDNDNEMMDIINNMDINNTNDNGNGNKPPPQTFIPIWFIINGLGITIIAFLGIIGNFLSAIVLSRPQMKSSVTCLLLGLAFCDTLLILISILIFGLPAISDYTGKLLYYRYIYYPILVQYLYPISITAQTGSVYLTLSVTIERFIVVCHPLHARSLCTWSRARFCVFFVIFLAILYNLPRWFEVCLEESDLHFDDEMNSTVYENYMCPIRANALYKQIYINWVYLIVMYLVPFTGLVVFNWTIYEQVRRANLTRCTLSKLQKREMSLATMLLFVVTVFLLCNILPLVNNILESFYNTNLDWLVQLSNFLVVLNSSVNFVIYCSCGERFRRLLVRLCRQLMKCERAAHFYQQHQQQQLGIMRTTEAYSFKRSSRSRKNSSCLLNGNNNGNKGSKLGRKFYNNNKKHGRRNQLDDGEIELEDISVASMNPSNHTATLLLTPVRTSNLNGHGHGHERYQQNHHHHGMLVIDLSSA